MPRPSSGVPQEALQGHSLAMQDVAFKVPTPALHLVHSPFQVLLSICTVRAILGSAV